MCREQLAASAHRVDELKSQLLIHESLSGFDGSGSRRFGGLCLRCGQREALVAGNSTLSASHIDQLAR